MWCRQPDNQIDGTRTMPQVRIPLQVRYVFFSYELLWITWDCVSKHISPVNLDLTNYGFLILSIVLYWTLNITLLNAFFIFIRPRLQAILFSSIRTRNISFCSIVEKSRFLMADTSVQKMLWLLQFYLLLNTNFFARRTNVKCVLESFRLFISCY